MGLFGKKRGDKRHDYTTAQTTEEAEAIAKARKFEEWLKLIKQKILETSNETLEENRERSHYLYWIKGGLEDFAKRNPSKTEDCSRLIFAADLLAAELWMERQYMNLYLTMKKGTAFLDTEGVSDEEKAAILKNQNEFNRYKWLIRREKAKVFGIKGENPEFDEEPFEKDKEFIEKVIDAVFKKKRDEEFVKKYDGDDYVLRDWLQEGRDGEVSFISQALEIYSVGKGASTSISNNSPKL